MSRLRLCATLIFLAPTAVAQPSGALAETLFQEGKRLLDAERYAEACVKFEQSQKLDPAVGTLPLLLVPIRPQGRTQRVEAIFN